MPVVFTSVVVGIDGSAESDDALRWALAEARHRQLPMRAVCVWYPDGTPEASGELRSKLDDGLASHVGAVAAAAGERDVPIVRRVLYGHPAEVLIHEAGDDGLLVVGSRGRGAVKASMLGSVSHSCAQSARGAVAVVRGHGKRRMGGRVVVGVDGSRHSMAALRFAQDDAATWGADLVVMHAWALPYMTTISRVGSVPPEAFGEAEAQARARLFESLRGPGVDPSRPDVQIVVVRGYPGPALLAAAEDADLLVVGTRGTGGWKGLLLGSVSTVCLTHSPCPVVVTRDRLAQ